MSNSSKGNHGGKPRKALSFEEERAELDVAARKGQRRDLHVENSLTVRDFNSTFELLSWTSHIGELILTEVKPTAVTRYFYDPFDPSNRR